MYILIITAVVIIVFIFIIIIIRYIPKNVATSIGEDHPYRTFSFCLPAQHSSTPCNNPSHCQKYRGELKRACEISVIS